MDKNPVIFYSEEIAIHLYKQIKRHEQQTISNLWISYFILCRRVFIIIKLQ
jgi:hypothetical protein